MPWGINENLNENEDSNNIPAVKHKNVRQAKIRKILTMVLIVNSTQDSDAYVILIKM